MATLVEELMNIIGSGKEEFALAKYNTGGSGRVVGFFEGNIGTRRRFDEEASAF